MKSYVVVDIGCIECGEPSKVVGIYPTERKAFNAYKKYIKNVDPEGSGKPSSAMKLFLSGDECVKNGELWEHGYFSEGQHSIKVYVVDDSNLDKKGEGE